MSIETDLSSIAQSLATIAAIMSDAKVTPSSVTIPKPPIEVKAPVAEVPKQATPSTTLPLPSMAPPVTTMPMVETPASATTSAAPFANAAELTSYVMNAYKTLGPIKGAKIQEVLQSVGAKNINEVKPEHYATVKAGVDALQ